MSFEELAKRSAGHPEAEARAAERRDEIARRPWHDAFLAEVYPSWQGAMVRMSRKAGVESATQAAHSGLPAATNIGAIERLLPKRTWLICEVIRVQAHVGVGAFVGYAFSGDETDGALARIAGTTDGPLLTCLPEMTKQWAGPRPKVLQFAEEDVDVASNLFGTLLVRALDAKEERLEREASDVRAAEEARVAAEAKAAEELEARRKKLADAQAARAAEDAAENEPA